MTDPLAWIIIALFYVPVHYLVPVLVTLMRSSDRTRRAAVVATLVDCTLSMTLSFSLAIWLITRDQVTPAMAILLLSMALPYVRILMRSARHGNNRTTGGPDEVP